MRECVSSEVMAEFLAARAPGEQARRLNEHLQECAECQSLAEALSEDASLRRALHLRRAGLQNSMPWLTREFKEQLYRLPAAGSSNSQPRLPRAPALPRSPFESDEQGEEGDTDELHRSLSTTQSAPALDGTPSAVEGRLGRFWLRRQLGVGGFGVVYLADDPVLERQVALKLPKISALADPDLRSRFLREARLAAGLRHPNIVEIYEAKWTGNLCYIASAYCSGPTLAEWSQESRLSPRTAAEIVRQLADAVQHAHHSGILHRDIKPQNVLLEPAPVRDPEQTGDTENDCLRFTPMLTDFGTARLLDAPGITGSGVLLGTPLYMAPEQACGRHEDVGVATDVYSLGAILYELLTDRPPILGRNSTDTLRRVVTDEPVAPRCLAPAVPHDLEAICVKCLEKSPARRYSGARQLAEDLHRFLAGEPTQARPVSRAERLVRWARRDPSTAGLLTVLITGAVLLLAGFGVHTARLSALNQRLNLSLHDARESREQTQQLLYVSDVRLAEQAWKRHDIREFRERLKRWQPAPEEPDRRGFEWHYLWQKSDIEHVALAGHRGHVYCICWSPDGRQLATAGEDGIIRLWSARTGVQQGKFDSTQGEVNGLAFTRNGKQLASTGDDGSIRIWTLPDGIQQLKIDAHPDEAHQVAFAPGDQLLASCGNDPVVRLWDAQSGHSRGALAGHIPAGEHAFSVESIAISPDGAVLASVSEDATAKLWNLRTREVTGTTEIRPAKLRSVAFAPPGKYFITGDDQGRIEVRSSSGTQLLGKTEVLDRVQCLDVSADGNWFVAGDRGGMVHLYGLQRIGRGSGAVALDEAAAVWQAHPERVWAVQFSPDGNRVASAGAEGTVRVWDRKRQAAPQRFDLRAVNFDVAALPDSRVAIAGESGLQILDVAVADAMKRIPDAAESSALSSQAACIQILDRDCWFSIAVSPDGESLAGGSSNGTVAVWRLSDGLRFGSWKLNTEANVSDLQWSPNGTTLVAICNQDDDHAWLIDTTQDSCTPAFPADRSHISAFSPDGHLLAVAAGNDIIVWDYRSRRERFRLKGHTNGIMALGFSPDGCWISSGSADRSVRLWNAKSGAEQFLLLGHTDAVHALSFASDGRSLVTAASGGLIVWHVETGQKLCHLDEATSTNERIAFTRNGRQLLRLDTHDRLSIYSW